MENITKTSIPQEFGPKKFKCMSGDNSYTQSGNLRSLIKEVQEGFRNYECSPCGKSFKRKNHMNGHIQRIQESIYFWNNFNPNTLM